MIRRALFYAALLAAVCLPAAAQDFTTVTAVKIKNGKGTLLPSGTISFLPADLQGNPQPYRLGGGGQGEMTAFPCSVVAGAIVGTCQTPNTATTMPGPICLKTIVKDSGGQLVISGPGYACVQPTGTTFNFDNYVPTTPPAAGIINNSISGNVAIIGNLSITGTLSGAGVGTVTSFSSGNLAPLFTTSVTTSTSTPAQTFSLSNAAAFSVFGNNSGSSAAPSFQNSLSLTGVINSGTGFQINVAAPLSHYLRGNGTNYVDSAIPAGDVPILNQNTTGTAANVTGVVAIANGGTGTASTAPAHSVFGNNTAGTVAPAFSTSANLDGSLTVNGNAIVGGVISNGNISASASTVSAAAISSSGTITASGNINSGNDLNATSGNVTALVHRINANLTWQAGSGVPAAGGCTAANGGSLFSRTDGGTATTLYVCDNATHVWTAK